MNTSKLLTPRRISSGLIAVIIIGILVPVLHYWYFVGRVPSVSPISADNLLTVTDANAVLIDVSPAAIFDVSHLNGAVSWPYTGITELTRNDNLPTQFVDKKLILICDSGISSALAVQRLRAYFGVNAYNVTGGLQSWIAVGGQTEMKLDFRNSAGDQLPPPVRQSPVSEQIALATAVLIIKPLYMLISLALVIFLWRLKTQDMKALRWGMFTFLAGETFCAFNIIFFNHSNYLLELLHMYGMILSFGFFVYALIEALDKRVIKFSDPDTRCAAAGLCGRCAKNGEGICGLKKVLYFVIPVLIIIASMPLLANWNSLSYNTEIFGLTYNYSHPVVFQIFETRYAPGYAIILLGASFVALLLEKGNSLTFTRILFAAGSGALAFSFLRLGFWSMYRDNLLWPNFWEELTELIYVSGVSVILWTFRRSLFPAKNLNA